MEFKTDKNIIYECVAGSHAYGTNVHSSDVDVRGVYLTPKDEYISLRNVKEQESDKKNDITFYDLRRFFHLAMNANPNILELMWMPEGCIRKCTEPMRMLLDSRDMFISQKAKHSFCGYAYSQLERAQGQNKWVNNPQPEERPSKLDFCWYVPLFSPTMEKVWDGDFDESNIDSFPMRPIKLSMTDIDLDDFNAAKMEHTTNTYRLYDVDNPKGVFRGDDMQLVVESISKQEEFLNIKGLLIFNEQAYDAACKDWKNYWEWRRNRNDARWVSQENGDMDYDAKNMAHCVRILISGIHIMEHGCPIVRFEGEERELLMAIRRGVFEYEELVKMAKSYEARLDAIVEHTKMPHAINTKALNDLYCEIMNEYG